MFLHFQEESSVKCDPHVQFIIGTIVDVKIGVQSIIDLCLPIKALNMVANWKIKHEGSWS